MGWPIMNCWPTVSEEHKEDCSEQQEKIMRKMVQELRSY